MGASQPSLYPHELRCALMCATSLILDIGFTRHAERMLEGKKSLAFQSVAPGDYFEFTPDCVLNGDYRVYLEHK